MVDSIKDNKLSSGSNSCDVSEAVENLKETVVVKLGLLPNAITDTRHVQTFNL